MDAIPKHRSHPEIVKRLRRAEKAIGQAKKALIEDHLDHCLDAVVGPMEAGQRQEIADFKAIAKYL
jgi:DNA-binding FrmR family transcriptional regulator